MRKLIIAGAMAVAVMAVPAVASAATLDGTCSISGTSTFTKPLTNTPGANSYSFTADPSKSKCSGRINGGPVTLNVPIDASVAGSGTLSCGAGVATGAPGTLILHTATGDVTVGFKLNIVAAATQVALAIQGNGGGVSTGDASFATHVDPATAQACGGAGISSLGFDANIIGSITG